ncbi:signal transduction histidine kinase [Bradyrhizobium sp. RT6a]|uniref:sensor histidine kinase n=1 Tax=Bradyrhizobium sp. RT6a TaxID=3156381 RepID=UPI00339554C7
MSERVAAAETVRLADFIRANVDPIVEEWVKFAGTRTPASETMTRLALQDHIVELLTFIADDLETAQTHTEQVEKSQGLGAADGNFTRSAAEIHAALRLSDGFNIDQMVSEYRALRASVIKQWTAASPALSMTDLEDMTRFNEALDQAMAESVAEYTKMINQSRDMFLGVLGHDLRNPIGAVLMAARRMTKQGGATSTQNRMAEQIEKTMERATSILDDLLELTRSAFGSAIPLRRTEIDLSVLGAQIVEEMRSLSDVRQIELTTVGETRGEWDQARLGQVFSNLIGNALQYSAPRSTIAMKIVGEVEQVLVSVHNDGEPIPPDQQKSIFNPLTRGTDGGASTHSANLGLGLFITHKIVSAHGGTITVHSAVNEGTTFTLALPRK